MLLSRPTLHWSSLCCACVCVYVFVVDTRGWSSLSSSIIVAIYTPQRNDKYKLGNKCKSSTQIFFSNNGTSSSYHLFVTKKNWCVRCAILWNRSFFGCPNFPIQSGDCFHLWKKNYFSGIFFFYNSPYQINIKDPPLTFYYLLL